MEELDQGFLERAESRGGEPWLRRCLELSAVEEDQCGVSAMLQPGPSAPTPAPAPAPAPAAQGKSLMHNVILDILVYLPAIYTVLSSAGIPISVGFPASTAASSSGSASVSFSAPNVTAPVSPSHVGSTLHGDS